MYIIGKGFPRRCENFDELVFSWALSYLAPSIDSIYTLKKKEIDREIKKYVCPLLEVYCV